MGQVNQCIYYETRMPLIRSYFNLLHMHQNCMCPACGEYNALCTGERLAPHLVNAPILTNISNYIIFCIYIWVQNYLDSDTSFII